MRRWAKMIVKNNDFLYCRDLRHWWENKGRALHGDEMANKATSALTQEMALVRFGKS